MRRYALVSKMLQASSSHNCMKYFDRRSYTKKDKDPKKWGPCFWKYYHIGALTYPIKPTLSEMNSMIVYIMSIPESLPCARCTEHAQKFIEERVPFLYYIVSSRDSLFAFFVEFHNYVNKKQRKKLLTVEEAKRIWTDVLLVENITDGNFHPVRP